MQVITWNLFHGRSSPDQPRYLYDEFAAAIGGWDWDVLLLQEVPPWWPRMLATHFGADHRHVLTSRNIGLALRRALATRRPDLIKANGGGANAILVRDREIVTHHSKAIRHWPERRLVHGAELDDGHWIVNLHMQGRRPAAVAENERIGALALQWAGPHAPVILGGDFNISDPHLTGFEQIPGHRGVDQLFVRNLKISGRARALERGTLSDHRPVRAKILT